MPLPTSRLRDLTLAFLVVAPATIALGCGPTVQQRLEQPVQPRSALGPVSIDASASTLVITGKYPSESGFKNEVKFSRLKEDFARALEAAHGTSPEAPRGRFYLELEVDYVDVGPALVPLWPIFWLGMPEGSVKARVVKFVINDLDGNDFRAMFPGAGAEETRGSVFWYNNYGVHKAVGSALNSAIAAPLRQE